MKSLTFYTHPQSRGNTVRWMLEECGASFDTVLMDFDGSLQSPEYLAINPMGKIPTLRYGDTVITETAAIILFLADLFPEKQLAPAVGSAERGEYYRWFCFMAGPMEAAVMEKMWKLSPPAEARKSLGYGDFERVVRTVEQALSGKNYLVGKHFTAADLYMEAFLSFSYRMQVWPESSVCRNYIQRIEQREAYIRAMRSMETA